jgi:sugar lactone lactonase YvrE
MLRRNAAFAALVLVLVAVGVGPAVAKDALPSTINLPTAWQPEGIAIKGHTFYVGSIPTGSVYRGDLRTGQGAPFIVRTGRAATGLEVKGDRLFVSGAGTGKAFVYNVKTGADVATYTFDPGFINDVVVTKNGAYFTNSNVAALFRIPIQNGQLGSTPQRIPLTGDFQLVPPPAFNANGIDATRNGKWLIIVQTATGKLFRVNPSTGATVQINLGGATVPNGDGILLDKKNRLFVVQNQLNQIAVIDLNKDLTSGKIVSLIKDTRFAIPTTIDDYKKFLYAVNAKFGSPPASTKYEVVQVAKPGKAKKKDDD